MSFSSAVDGERAEHVRVADRGAQVRNRARLARAARRQEEVLLTEAKGATHQVNPSAIFFNDTHAGRTTFRIFADIINNHMTSFKNERFTVELWRLWYLQGRGTVSARGRRAARTATERERPPAAVHRRRLQSLSRAAPQPARGRRRSRRRRHPLRNADKALYCT